MIHHCNCSFCFLMSKSNYIILLPGCYDQIWENGTCFTQLFSKQPMDQPDYMCIIGAQQTSFLLLTILLTENSIVPSRTSLYLHISAKMTWSYGIMSLSHSLAIHRYSSTEQAFHDKDKILFCKIERDSEGFLHLKTMIDSNKI